MNAKEAECLIKEIESQALRKLDKQPIQSFAEGKNYGILLMVTVAKHEIEKRVKESDTE